MGDATWLDYLNRFKFGVPTRFGLTDEYAGQLPADNIVNIAMSAFGQGISVTQTQMLRALQPLPTMGLCWNQNLSVPFMIQMTSLFVSLKRK